MDLLTLRKELKEKCKSVGVDPLDVDFVAGEVLGVASTELVLISEIPNSLAKKIEKIVNKRLTGEPVDKIFKKAYFYGLPFKVNDNVLTPRADSELLVDAAIAEIKQNQYKTVLDLCTGSGCLAIGVKNNSLSEMTACDYSKKAIKLAKYNAKLNGAEIKFIHSNMFEKISEKYDLIISNPPYIETGEIKTLQKEVREHDPIMALDGGADGLDFYRIIAKESPQYLNVGGMLILEIGDTQKDQVKEIFSEFEFVKCVKDYGGHDRVLIFKLYQI